jgi:hypothetical protein
LVQRRQIFLTKAKEADVKAEWAKDLSVKATWREIAEMYRELAQLDRPATAERPLPIAKSGHKPVADGKPVPQRVIRIHKRADGTYVGRNEVKTERPLGVDANLSDALMTAKRQAVLDSGRGYRVVIEVQDSGKTWRQVDVVEPPRTR